MKIEFHCTGCGAELTSEEQFRGEVIRCPTCTAEVIVPLTSVGPGAVVNGFKILRKIGAGGMGAVYLAEQKSMGRLVALKVLPPAFTRDPLFFDRFMKEVRMQGSLSHPNIATAYDAGRFGDICYMAMEYVEGFDLADMIEKKGHLEERAALRIARKVASGLAYAWQKKQLIHRDIKPGNVMIAPNAEVKILDLGVSKTMHPAGEPEHATDEQVLGTPHYMSPEQMRESASVDIRSDIYSLGATLYHMLTGRPPFPGENLVEVVSKQSEGAASSPHDTHPELSDACVHLLEVMMARDPEERYDTWDHCIADINRVLLGRHPSRPLPDRAGSLVARSSRSSSPARAGRRRPARRLGFQVVWGLAAAFGVLVAVMYGLRPEAPMGNEGAGVEPAEAGGVNPTDPEAEAEPLEAETVRQRLQGRLATVDRQREADGRLGPSLAARYRRIAADAEVRGEGDIAAEARTRAASLRSDHGEAVRAALEALEAETAPLIEAGKYGEAAARLRSYDGPEAAATARVRSQRAEALDALERERAEAAWAEFQKELADRLLAERSLESAAVLFTRARTDENLHPVRDDVRMLEQEFKEALLIPDEVIASYTNDIGRELEIQLARGPKTLRIERVDGRGVIGSEMLAQGRLQYTFGYRDLSPTEKGNRLSRLGVRAAPVALGLLALEADQPESAKSWFERSEGRLGALLAESLNADADP